MRYALLAALLLVASETGAAAADRTSALLAALDRCDRATVTRTGPDLGVLLALADGRSGPELADLIQGPRNCTGYVVAFGHGAGEVVLVGSAMPAAPGDGAVLWVDQGWWRIAVAPVGYLPYPVQLLDRGSAREVFVGIASGGSAGPIGAMAVRLDGPRARTIWRLEPDLTMEVSELRVLDDDHLYVEGRDTHDHLYTWNAHAGWPGGAQRLYVRRGDTFVLADARQSRDPDWVLSGYIGALFDGDAATMGRFATPSAVSAGLALPLPRRGPLELGPLDYDAYVDLARVARAEWSSWSALPDASRVPPPAPTYATRLGLRLRGWPAAVPIVVTFVRHDDGWTIADLAPLTRRPGGVEILP